MNPAGELRGRLALAALVVLAAWEIGRLAAVRARAPGEEDWRRAAALVRASFEPGDLIVFAPDWIDPIGRHWLGDLVTLEQAGRMDAARYARVWEISARGAAAPEMAGEVAAREETARRLRVRQFVRAAPVVTWDLRPRSRLHEVDFRPRQGVLVELRRPGASERLRFPAATLGTELQVYAGLAGVARRRLNRASAVVSVLVDGGEVARGEVDDESGWTALPAAAVEPGPHLVELAVEIGDPGPPVVLDVCVAAESRIAR